MMDLKNLKKGSYIVHENEPCIIKDINLDSAQTDANAEITLKNLFSGEKFVLSIPLHEQVQEVDIIRKCATIISKKDDTLEIMDVVNFDTFDANISKELLEQAAQGNQVTYIQFENITKVLEVRKQ